MNVQELYAFSQKFLPLLILIGLVSVVFWWVQQLNEPYTLISSDHERHDPDYYMQNFTITNMDKDGVLLHKLGGVYAAHYPDTNTTEVDKPRLITYKDEKELWTIDAPKGVVNGEQDEVTLHGKVHIVKPNQDGSVSRLDTSEMFIDLKLQQAHTEQDVKIENSNGITQARGMLADLRNEQVKLLANVKGRYTPHQSGR